MKSQEPLPAPQEHTTRYTRTVVIGDIHGDLDTLLASLAAKRVLDYDGDVEAVAGHVRTSLRATYSRNLEALVIPQEPRLQLVFLGDLVDRWHQGCYVIRFLIQVRWERFGIDAVFLLGNHDMLNLHFFLNPFRVYQIHEDSDFSMGQRLDYVSSMGIGETLKGFLELHRGEIEKLQRKFYKQGFLDWDLGYARLRLEYNQDLSALLGYRAGSRDDLGEYFRSRIRMFGREADERRNSVDTFLEHLGDHENPGGQNWWQINPPSPSDGRDHHHGFKWGIFNFNRFCDEVYDDDESRSYFHHREPRILNYLPIDWRVISLVWRRYYGDYFARTAKMIHRDGTTLFSHAGLSPQALLDSQALGVMHRLTEDTFWELDDEDTFYTFDHVLARANRLARQVIVNALNDYSFSCMCGAEIMEVMGVWRGGKNGFTQFGGLFWDDCDYLNHRLSNERLKELYRKFLAAAPIRRVICGHTRFESHKDKETRYRQLALMSELGLDYLSVDNSCSRGYDRLSVWNGIEIDGDGRILDPGGAWPKFY